MPANENALTYFAGLKKPKKTEAYLQKHLCLWMKTQYPNLIFRSGMEGLHLSMVDAQYSSIVNSHRGFPDLMIFEPKGSFAGLAIELKTDEAKVFKKDGSLCKNEHLAEQATMLEMLSERGWITSFAQGWDEARDLIEKYLKL